MSSKQGKTVVVTGCSTGIGEAVATLMATEGWTVFACVRKEADAKNIQSKHANIRPLYVDVTNQEQIDKAFEEVRVAVGEHGLDALVNNAGLAYNGPVEFMPIDDVERQFNINVFGLIRITQAAMPLLRLGDPGRIINISSIAVHLKFPYGGAYCASKAAVDAFSESLRREVDRWGIKVSVVRPGPVATNFEATAMQIGEELRARYPPGTKCYEYYGRDLDHYPETAREFSKYNAPVSKVAATIKNLLYARSPRNAVYDTWGTWLSMKIMSWMPLSLIDRFLKGMLFAKN